eukprot:799499-Prorocentrum_minimum.AAC.1
MILAGTLRLRFEYKNRGAQSKAANDIDFYQRHLIRPDPSRTRPVHVSQDRTHKRTLRPKPLFSGSTTGEFNSPPRLFADEFDDPARD